METLKVVLFVAFGLVCSVVCDEEHGTNAFSYEKDNFADEIAKKPHFVMFFAPWCGHCKRLAPTWDELAKKFNADPATSKALIAKVDCTIETALCSQNEVTGYPTLKFFKSADESARYKGPRDFASLEKFIQEQLGAPAEEEEPEAPAEGGYVQLTSDSFDSHIEKGFHFIKFYAPWCPHCKNLEPAWEQLAKTLQDDKSVSIARVDCTEHRAVCDKASVSGYPTLLWYAGGEKVEKYQGSRSHDDLLAYAKKMMAAGDASKAGTQEKVPDAQPGDEPVAVLTSENFKDTVASGTTFVKFYAPWCGHCKRLAPTWEDLGKKFLGNTKITIAKVDCTTDRELCTEHGVRGFPTLVIFRNGERKGEHQAGRDIDSLVQFVSSQVPHDEL